MSKREHTLQNISPLPPDYRQVEYLKTYSGNTFPSTYIQPSQRINTQYYPNNNTRILCKTRGETWIFGARTSLSVGDAFGICLNANLVYMQFGAESPRYDRTNIYYDIIEWDLSQNGCFENGVRRASFSQQTFNTAYTLWLFNLNNAGNINGGLNGNMYFCKIWNNGSLVRDYIPVIRTSDSKAGMYDLCGSICNLTNTPFYTNVGSGQFYYN